MVNAHITDIPEDDYFAGVELSASGSKVILDLPARYQWQRTHPIEPTPAMQLGSALHTSVLGTGKPFVVIDDRRTKEGKAAAAEAAETGAIVLGRVDGELVEAMTDAVQAHATAAAILSEGAPERTVYWTDDETGVDCRARIDWLRDNAIVDLKSTVDASPAGFGRQAANLRYDLQAHAYTEAIRHATGQELPFLFIAVEKNPPHYVAVHQLPPEAMERGARLWREALATFAECQRTGHWPDYGTDIITTPWPTWAA